MMMLVKDLDVDRIVYYWIDEGKTVSPNLPSIERAQEWVVQYTQQQYTGINRRSSHIDRRKLHNKRDDKDNKYVMSNNPTGRRSTDIPVKVSIDLSIEKIKDLTNNGNGL